MAGDSIFERITIIGLGLIGSSIARAAWQNRLADIIVGCDSNEVSLAYARAQGFINVGTSDPKTAVVESQLVILATPPSSLGDITRRMAPNLSKGVIVMDTASVKKPAMQTIAAHLPKGVLFIPAHPIAGSEQSGVAAGKADLFKRKQVIITPEKLEEGTALQLITAFWAGMGAKVEGMPPALHDLVYAYVSHLPQLLAFAIADIFKGPAGRDPDLSRFLRLTHSDAALWADIFITNKENVIKALDAYLKAISHIHGELANPPEKGGEEANEMLAKNVLFPRIAASCLITSVMVAERENGCPFGRFAGAGFADFTSPATTAPEGDIEQISSNHAAVAPLLKGYANRLIHFHALINAGNASELTLALKP